jgi:hypothetical protein
LGDQVEDEMGGACGTYGREERCMRDLVGKPERKRPLGRHRRVWEDNIKTNLQEIRRGGRGVWMHIFEYVYSKL